MTFCGLEDHPKNPGLSRLHGNTGCDTKLSSSQPITMCCHRAWWHIRKIVSVKTQSPSRATRP